jgi:hypothetical protein
MGLTQRSLSGSRQTSLQVLPTFCYLHGFPEGWIKWVMAFCEIENLMPLKELANKTRMFRTLLKDQILSYFEHHLKRRLEVENLRAP